MGTWPSTSPSRTKSVETVGGYQDVENAGAAAGAGSTTTLTVDVENELLDGLRCHVTNTETYGDHWMLKVEGETGGSWTTLFSGEESINSFSAFSWAAEIYNQLRFTLENRGDSLDSNSALEFERHQVVMPAHSHPL